MSIENEETLRRYVGHLVLGWREGQGRGLSNDDPTEVATMIEAAHVVADESRLALHRWVDAGRRAGLSWGDIGALTGVTKQAAQQRFGHAAEVETDADEIVVRLGATAFNEVAILDREGAAGRELMAIGPLQLIFRESGGAWEHRRVTAIGSHRDAMAADGWTYVASWLIFHYFKRRTG